MLIFILLLHHHIIQCPIFVISFQSLNVRQKLNLLLYNRFAPPCETPRNKLQAWTRLCAPDKIPAPIIWLRPRPRIEKEKPCYSKNRGRKKKVERHIIWAPTIRSRQQKSTRVRMVGVTETLLTLHSCSCSALVWMSPVLCSPVRACLSLSRPASNDSIALYKSQPLLVPNQVDNKK